jgi:hypothetical protein
LPKPPAGFSLVFCRLAEAEGGGFDGFSGGESKDNLFLIGKMINAV